jgi:hypothetical protein
MSSPQRGVNVTCVLVFIACAFLLTFVATTLALSLPLEIGADNLMVAGKTKAGGIDNKSGYEDSTSSSCESAHMESATLQSAAGKSEGAEPAYRGCTITRREFFSDACDGLMAYYAFVPTKLNDAERCPVLYLLHGAYDGCTAWKSHAEKEICDLASEYRIIIVTPEGGSFGWYADSRFLKKNRIETYFFNELIPDVEKTFPAGGLRSIAGLSMGGHGAFVLSFRHPGVFKSVSSMSGILDITRHKTQWKLSDVFGPYSDGNMAEWNRHSVLKLIEQSSDKIPSIPMLITVSTGDRCAVDENRLVHAQLERMNVKHLYYEAPGGHDWTYWTSQLPLHVSFHACWLKEAGF